MFPILEVAATPLQILWFVLIVVLWVGYFFLEGFDYGVAMNLPIIGKTDKDRRVMINTVGPVWDGNEVWLLTAGGATFAAFPGWYSTLFSALYLPLLLVLLGLILRGISFEYRAKRDNAAWRSAFDWCATIGSLLPALVFGVGLANFVKGLPLGTRVLSTGRTQDFLFSGTFLSLFSPYGLLGGVMLVVLFLAHGAIFLSLKTKGEVRERSRRYGFIYAAVAAVLLAIFVIWGNLNSGYVANVPAAHNHAPIPVVAWILGLLAVLAVAAAAFLIKAGHEGKAFIAGALGIVALVVMVFFTMWPNLGFTTVQGRVLDVTTASSSAKTLGIMTIAAVIFVPIVLAYQAWTYWVFRKRIGTQNLPVEPDERTQAGRAAGVADEENDPLDFDAADADDTVRTARKPVVTTTR